jgi:stage II sporulation protein D
LKGIDVRRRGDSPRIVSADVVGTRGRTRVSGGTLRSRLGLYDTWVYFTTITSKSKPKKKTKPEDTDGTGGTAPQDRSAHLASATAPARRLTGEVFPASARGTVTIEERAGGRWRAVCQAATNAKGRYVFTSSRPGTFRVRYLADVGPAVRLK